MDDASPRCQQQLLELSAYLEGDLTPDRIAALDAHLDGCTCCGEMAASLRRTIALCRSEEARDLPDAVRRRALAAVRALLGGAGAPGPTENAGSDGQSGNAV